MKNTFRLTALILLLLGGCSSLRDDVFVIRRLDAAEKAKALTEKGIEEFNVSLVRRQQYEKLPEVREYFTVALRYDPQNPQARRYLALLAEFRSTKVREKLRETAVYLARQNRREEESYALLVTLQDAARLDPSNPEVARLLRETAGLRTTLVEAYLGRCQAAAGGIGPDTPPEERETLAIDAFQNACRAAAVDPRSTKARGRKESLYQEVAAIVSRRSEAVRRQIGAERFDEAQVEAAALAALDLRLGGSFEAEVRSVSYTLQYRWAQSLLDRKDYAQAEERIDQALSIDRTPEAAALKRRIADLCALAEQEAAFHAGLQEIDGLIARRDLSGAKRRIDALARANREPGRLDLLETRLAKLRSFLNELYDRAVAAYRNEKFKDAIDLLQTVVQIDAAYQQASDYLDKAKAKQRVLDQYQGDGHGPL
jgi:hypothetical protein